MTTMPKPIEVGKLLYDPGINTLKVMVDGEWRTVGPVPTDGIPPEWRPVKQEVDGEWKTVGVVEPSPRGSSMSFQARNRNHPNSYKRKDGKTQCPDCHAISLDAEALNSLPCTVPPEYVPPPEKDVVHITPLPPSDAKVGDLWIDTSHVLRMMCLDRLTKDGPETVLWVDIGPTAADVPWHMRGIAVSAPWKQGYNPKVKEVGLSKQVTHFKTIKDIEQQYYETEMNKALNTWLDDNEMVAVTLPQFHLDQDASKPSAVISISVMARSMPEPFTAKYDTQLKPIRDEWKPTTGALYYDISNATLMVNVGDKWVPVAENEGFYGSGGVGR